MSWSKWVRQTHRWLSIAFTVGVTVNFVAVSLKKYSAGVGLLAGIPLALQTFTGLYLFVLSYTTKWRSRRLYAASARRLGKSPNDFCGR